MAILFRISRAVLHLTGLQGGLSSKGPRLTSEQDQGQHSVYISDNVGGEVGWPGW